MNLVKTYGTIIKKYADTNPKTARKLIQTGFHLELFRTRHLATKGMPAAYQKLNTLAVKSTLFALEHPEQTAWTNIFTPVEILQCFGLNSLSIECLSSFMSGFTCEDYFIDHAEQEGIAPTLCSYHKDFIGAADSGVIPKPVFSTTTSMICDGNINTFRHLEKQHGIDTFYLDVPNEYSKDAVNYVTAQLKEMISTLEHITGKVFDMDELSLVLQRENESKQYYKKFLEEKKKRYYPTTLTLQLYMLFATHLQIGSKETLDFFRSLYEDILTYPEFQGKRIVWVHLLPFYQETLKHYFNLSDHYQIQACDLNLDYMEELDVTHPLEALATKMLCNLYNGPYAKKADFVASLAKDMNADGVIHFCHWGCKQSSGGIFQLKQAMKTENIPLLILDGDGMDRRNSHDGQIKTRLEAFLELLNNLDSTI